MNEISFVGLKQQHKKIKKEIIYAVEKVLDDSYFILGENLKEFEKKFSKYCGVNYSIGINSGTDALFLALKSLNIGKGDEVITVPNSFIATASSIVATNATPVFVDVREDMNMNPNLLKDVVSSKTRAIIPVHLTGKPADMKPILEFADDHDLYVIEDAAQAVGAEYYNKKVGSFGHVNCFSLHPLKILNACGDGGVITTNSEEIYNNITQLRNIGLKNRNESDFWGYNSRLDTLQAAILNVKLKYLDIWIEKRRTNAKYYNDKLKDIVKLPIENHFEKCVYQTYTIKVKERNKLKQFLADNKIDTKIHYPIPIHLQKAAEKLNYKKGSMPMTEQLADSILALPSHQDLIANDRQYIVDKIIKFYSKK
jgi:dTDP-4-amino-4,6-dideoxygalactose transaminase